MLSDVLFTSGALIMMTAPTVPLLMVGRLVIGFGVGIAALVVPVYISEIAPVEIRGTLVACDILFCNGGQFISSVISYVLGRNWRLMLGLAGVPSII